MRDKDSDQSLVKRFQRGDREAFELLIRRHQDRIYRLAMTLVYTPGDAADATQEVFLRAMKGLKKFRFRASPFTWLYRTTKNVCLELNRKNRPGREPESAIEADIERGMVENFSDKQCAAAVRSLVASLPERQRDVVLLRYFEELSVNDTATAMGCRPGTVKALLHKAITGLKKTGHMRDMRWGVVDDGQT